MDSLMAFAMAKTATAQGSPQRVFDWDRAAALIRERRPETASAGLGSDWEYTGGTIYRNGDPVRGQYTYLSSNWATPELDMDGDVQPCWRLASDAPGWDADTKWPDSALAILSGNVTPSAPGPTPAAS